MTVGGRNGLSLPSHHKSQCISTRIVILTSEKSIPEWSLPDDKHSSHNEIISTGLPFISNHLGTPPST